MQALFNSILRSSALIFLPAGLLALSIPVEPAHARNMYDVCVGQMVAVGVERQQAGAACAEALIPKELSKCVSRVALVVSVPAQEAVKNCFQSRRPVDVANCVVDINNQVPLNRDLPRNNRVEETFAEPSPTGDATASPPREVSAPVLALESCRRSLQPGVYSQCVTALSRDITLENLTQALDTCLSAEAFPPSIFPNSGQY
ncbi:hypothetical protein [Gloeothece verrucosa]|nr:hypothetical protein [Gloeothece verrucosa]